MKVKDLLHKLSTVNPESNLEETSGDEITEIFYNEKEQRVSTGNEECSEEELGPGWVKL